LALAIAIAACGFSATSAQDSESGEIASLLSRATAGDASAQYALGQRYASGTGVARNLEEAYFWLVVAAENGIAAAEEPRNTIGTALRASQFVRVQRRISEWRAAGAQPAPGGAEPRATRPARTGSGIVVADGRILTSNHGIVGCSNLTLQGAASGNARVIANDGDLDLALLAVEGSTVATARFRAGNDVPLGTEVVVFGYPLQGLLA
jgi:S1-C subfamily serine protease